MSPVYQRSHDYYVKQFSYTGKSKALYRQTKVFCLHKMGYIFQAYKFLKLYLNPRGNLEYVSLIRPILKNEADQTNFIVLNENWEIDSMSHSIWQALNLDPRSYINQN